MNNLVLIGFMGSGKSSVGRALAQKTARFFLDTDALIESATNRRISDIFALEGETAFRERERELAAWLESSVNNAVISAGGGMIVSCANLKRAGEIVYLKCD
ncbi:MAG: shikimate kinase, partial [Helicobacteraceae bacterium]|nr:shikimate kinase [Helicobacteraceae bacterium]